MSDVEKRVNAIGSLAVLFLWSAVVLGNLASSVVLFALFGAWAWIRRPTTS